MEAETEVVVIADTAGLYELSEQAIAYLASGPTEFAVEADARG